MQKYPYLERNTQKLKNHTRRTGLLCRGSQMPWLRFKQSSQPFPLLTSYFLCFGTTYMQEDMHTSKSTQAQLGLFTAGLSLRSYEKTEAQHRPYSGSFGQCCFVELPWYMEIHHPHLRGPVEGMNPLMTLMPQLIFFEVFKLISWQTWVKSWKERGGKLCR